MRHFRRHGEKERGIGDSKEENKWRLE